MTAGPGAIVCRASLFPYGNNPMSPMKATLCGLCAILIWSMLIALMRSVTEAFGATLGAALVYSLGSFLLFLKLGLPAGTPSKPYLFVGGFFFVAYELLFSQSIGLAHDSRQTLEVGLVNYLWPCLIVVFSLIILKQKARLYLYPGLLLSFSGIVWCVSGGTFDLPLFMAHVSSNPVPYLLAFIAAVFWGLYCNVAKLFPQPSTLVHLFFLIIAVVLWLRWFISGESLPSVPPRAFLNVLLTAVSFASSYALWEVGIQKGNILFLATVSYFTPIFSTLFSCVWLSVLPAPSFWYGVGMVGLGSLLSWLATHDTADASPRNAQQPRDD